MQPLLLVLLVATSALAAPGGVNIRAAEYNEVTPPKDPGRLVSNYVTEQAFGIIDGGDSSVYILTVQNILNDLANQPDPNSQALALAQAIAVIGGLATGIPADACAAATLIDAYVLSLRNPNYNLRPALVGFINSLSNSIDLIVQLANNPESLRYAGGSRGSCAGGGRSYQFESAWDAILSKASSNAQASLLQEQYCAAKRLYGSFSVSSNNVGALVTAASLPPVTQVFRGAIREVANFLRAVPSNPAGAAAAAKKALNSGLNSY